MIDKEIKERTLQLIEHGTNYDLEFLDQVYDEELKFIRLDRHAKVEVLSKADNMAFFAERKAQQAPALNKEAEFHYADNDGENAYVILTRKMQQFDVDQSFLFQIQWKKKQGDWKIIREVVYLK